VTRLPTEKIHPSYSDYSINHIISDIKEDMLIVSDEIADQRIQDNMRAQPYELPDGQTIQMSS
jgi:hypothetical protein